MPRRIARPAGPGRGSLVRARRKTAPRYRRRSADPSAGPRCAPPAAHAACRGPPRRPRGSRSRAPLASHASAARSRDWFGAGRPRSAASLRVPRPAAGGSNWRDGAPRRCRAGRCGGRAPVRRDRPPGRGSVVGRRYSRGRDTPRVRPTAPQMRGAIASTCCRDQLGKAVRKLARTCWFLRSCGPIQRPRRSPRSDTWSGISATESAPGPGEEVALRLPNPVAERRQTIDVRAQGTDEMEIGHRRAFPGGPRADRSLASRSTQRFQVDQDRLCRTDCAFE